LTRRSSHLSQMSIYGLGQTADRQLERARSLLAGASEETLPARLLATEAGVLYQRGDLSGAEQSAHEALELLAGDDAGADAVQGTLVQALLTLARCREYFEDVQGAARYAQDAVKASLGDPEIRAIATKFSIPALPPKIGRAACRE